MTAPPKHPEDRVIVRDVGDREAEADYFRRIMAAPDYKPTLVPMWWVAKQSQVSPQAVTMWTKRSERTGVQRYPCGRVDLNAVALWELTRNGAQAKRRVRADAPVWAA